MGLMLNLLTQLAENSKDYDDSVRVTRWEIDKLEEETLSELKRAQTIGFAKGVLCVCAIYIPIKYCVTKRNKSNDDNQEVI